MEKKKCKNCQDEFEPYLTTAECTNCEDGIEEVWRDWNFDDPDYRCCFICKGEGEVKYIEDCFCSEDCRGDFLEEDY